MRDLLVKLFTIDRGPLVARDDAHRWADKIELWLVCLTVAMFIIAGLVVGEMA